MSTTPADFDEFFDSFIEMALWSSNLDHKTKEDISAHNLACLKAHALSFWCRMWYFIDHEVEPRPSCNGDHSPKQAGHDFWLTAVGRGAGFWDGDWPKYGDMLTKLSKCYPEDMDSLLPRDEEEPDIDPGDRMDAFRND